MSKNTKFKRVAQNLYIHSGVYYAVLKKAGKQIWRSLKTSDRNVANAKLETLRHQLLTVSSPVTRNHSPTFEQACKEVVRLAKADKVRHWSLKSIEGRLDLASRTFLGAMKIGSIQADHLREFLRVQLTRCSARTVNIDLIHLRKVFRLALQRGWRIDDPTTQLAPYKHHERQVPVPSQAEIQTVLTTLRAYPFLYGRRAADLIELMSLSGLRIAEAQALTWEDIDWQRRLLQVRHGKGDKPRGVDLFPDLERFLQSMRAATGTPRGRLFPPKVEDGRAFNPRKTLIAACEKAGVPVFSYHGLRHAWATHLVELGIDPVTIAGWMGHVDATLVVKRYGVHSRRQHFSEVAQRVTFDRPVVHASM